MQELYAAPHLVHRALMEDRKLSKFLSLVLRHAPERFGLKLDPFGWAAIDDVLRAKPSVTRESLLRVVADNDKQRFAISEDGKRIRANQGHSVKVALDLESEEPPAKLFHGTVERFLPAIREKGLKSMKRHHVHLSHDVETAKKVARRRGEPVILTVDAATMHANGLTFFRSKNGVWLTDKVASKYIIFPGQ